MSPEQWEPWVVVGGAARRGTDPRQVVAEVGGPAGNGASRQQLVEDRCGHRDPVGCGDALAPGRVGQVDPVDDRLDDSAGDELVESHERVVAGPDRLGRQGADSEIVLANVSPSTAGMSAGVLPSTIV